MAEPGARDRDPRNEDLRYERKFVAPQESVAQMLALLRTHPAFFREAYPPRFVNNIYFDDDDRQRYRESVDGRSDRTKIRVRWYGDLTGVVPSPVLEFKHKRGTVGWKRSIPVSGFSLKAGDTLGEIAEGVEEACRDSGTSLKPGGYRPALVNRYHRRYFVSADRVFRITVDTAMACFRLRHGSILDPDRIEYSRDLVLELKYAHDADSGAAAITEGIPIRLTKNSKFVIGTERLHGLRTV
ncbi:MAG: polyphosphate polymerase domain-containing protein [Chloroflexi bacterium]|nr:polyphosphate polymerase domain-containing protein [Chloroflexota bacterium]